MESQTIKIFCTECGTVIDDDNDFCPKCGTKKGVLPPQPRICTGCKAAVPEDMPFCGKCGTKYETPLAQPIPPVTVQPTPPPPVTVQPAPPPPVTVQPAPPPPPTPIQSVQDDTKDNGSYRIAPPPKRYCKKCGERLKPNSDYCDICYTDNTEPEGQSTSKYRTEIEESLKNYKKPKGIVILPETKWRIVIIALIFSIVARFVLPPIMDSIIQDRCDEETVQIVEY